MIIKQPKCDYKYANFKVLKEFGNNKRLKGSCYLIYMLLLMFHDEDTNDCSPSLDTIASIVGIDKKNVRVSIKKLIEEGMLVVKSNYGKCNNYYFPKEVYFREDNDGNIYEVPYKVPYDIL